MEKVDALKDLCRDEGDLSRSASATVRDSFRERTESIGNQRKARYGEPGRRGVEAHLLQRRYELAKSLTAHIQLFAYSDVHS